MPRIMAAGYPVEFIIQPHRVLMIFEYQTARRIVYTDGRKFADPDDIDPTFNGDSIGNWDGDTLFVETVGLRAEPTFDLTGAPHSDALRITERIRRVDENTLEDKMVIVDLKAFTKPWQVTRHMARKPGYELMEFFCNDNNRDFPGKSRVTTP